MKRLIGILVNENPKRRVECGTDIVLGHAGGDEWIPDDVLFRLSGSVLYVEKRAMIVNGKNHEATRAGLR